MRKLALGLPLLLLASCGDDGSGSPDAATIDASAVDGSGPDAMDFCPGQATFELGVEDWESGDAIAGVMATEIGGAAMASSAPNGRLLVCIDSGEDKAVRFTKDGYIPTTMHVDTNRLLKGRLLPVRLRLMTPAQRDAIYTSGLATVDTLASTVLVSVEIESSPNMGATVSVTPTGLGLFQTEDASTNILSGASTPENGQVLALNVEGASATIAISGGGICSEPDSLPLTANEVSAVLVSCFLE